MEKDKEFRLKDGRRLEYAEYGDPEGKTIIDFHGNPGSRYDWLSSDETLKEHGLRAICPDRPGWGLSDMKQGFKLADYPSDIAELADSLGLEKFSIYTNGIGTCYALPVIITLPDRVTSVTIASGFYPNSGQKLPSSFMLKLLALQMKGKLKDKTKFGPYFLQLFPKMDNAEPDTTILKDVNYEPMIQKAIDSFYEGLHRSLAGFMYDLKLVPQPWAFDFKDISPSIPVHVFHGDLDAQVKLSAVKEAVAKIPNCTAIYYPGEATISVIFKKMDELMDSIA